MLKIDGSSLEGGGQIVRTALALSVLTQKPFTVTNIRANRPDPGLKNQHLYGVRVLRDLCDAVVENAHLGSTDLTFYPRPIKKGQEITIDVETAGSLSLLLQSILLPCIFSGKKFEFSLKGGTDVAWSPSYDYTANIFFPQVVRYGAGVIALQKRGYYPKGQGEVQVKIKKKYVYEGIKAASVPIKPLMLTEQGTLVKIAGVSNASNDLAEARVAERQAEAARTHLQKWKVPVEITSSYSQTASTGSGITLWAIFTGKEQDTDTIDPIRIGADVLGERGINAETIGTTCAEQLNAAILSHAPVDKHLADQLIPLLGIVGGEIIVEDITDHTRTNIFVTELFLDVKFEVDERLKMIRCKETKRVC